MTSDNATGDDRILPRSKRMSWVMAAISLCLKLTSLLVVAGLSLWAIMAIRLTDLSGAPPRNLAALGAALCLLAVLLWFRTFWARIASAGVYFVIVLTWFLSHAPGGDRNWDGEFVRTATAKVDGDVVTLGNVRNFQYRSPTDYTPQYEDRTYNLSKLQSADYILSYWGSPLIAHVMVSFGFEDGQHIAFSVETRREKGEQYSAIQGFFRQYELIYVPADERDVIRVRTNVRDEDVYLYRIRAKPERLRQAFLTYVDRCESLAKQPEWYNAFTSNCGSNVNDIVTGQTGLQWLIGRFRAALTGISDERAYAKGAFDDSIPFAELKPRSRINQAANDAGDAADFSQRIRVGLPVPKPR